MSQPQFHIGIKNTVRADATGTLCELYFLDTIQDRQVFDWSGTPTATESLLAEVINQVKELQPKKIIQYIDSWGGDADLGKGIYNFLKSYPAEVETKIINKAASAATCIACAGDRITMPRTGMYVIHRASNRAEGTSDVLRDAAAVADLYTDVYCDIYAANNRKGKTSEEIKSLISDGDYWMTGAQACEMGFVDECYDDDEVNVTANIAAARNIYGDDVPAADALLQQPATSFNEKPIATKIENTMKNLSELVSGALAKLKSHKLTAKTSDDLHTSLVTALEPVLTDLAANMQTEVAAEMSALKTLIDEKYGQTISAQKTSIEKLETENKQIKATLESLTADLTTIAGAESRPGAKEKPSNARHPERRGLGVN